GFWHRGDIRHRLGPAKIRRRSDCARTGIDDKFSLSTDRTFAEAFSKRTTVDRWKIDNRGDALRRRDRLSRTRARDYCQDQGRALSREEGACDCDRGLRRSDRRTATRDRCRPSKSYPGRLADRRKSQRLSGLNSCCPCDQENPLPASKI